MTKHTPGPWIVEETPEHLWIGPPRHNSHKLESIVTDIDNSTDYLPAVRDTRIANARLIAAAPEMLEALMEAGIFLYKHESYFGSNGPWLLDHLRDVIKKAKGEQK